MAGRILLIIFLIFFYINSIAINEIKNQSLQSMRSNKRKLTETLPESSYLVDCCRGITIKPHEKSPAKLNIKLEENP